MRNYKDKINYLLDTVVPGLEEGFKRGDKTYTGFMHNTNSRFVKNRTAVEDINHIHDIHVGIRMREAQEAADNRDLPLALRKIESAIGYLIILHSRIRLRELEDQLPVEQARLEELVHAAQTHSDPDERDALIKEMHGQNLTVQAIKDEIREIKG